MKDLPSLAALYSENDQAATNVVTAAEESTLKQRLDAATAALARLQAQKCETAQRLLQLREPIHFARQEKTITMSDTNYDNGFSAKLMDALRAATPDAGVHSAQDFVLATARALLRALNNSGDGAGIPTAEEYQKALTDGVAYAQTSKPGWGPRSNPVQVKTNPGGLGGKQPRTQLQNVFSERLNPPPARSASDCYKAADAAVEANPALGRQYVRPAAVEALPHDLMGIFNHELGKLDVTERDRVGKAMRRAADLAPKSWLPAYGSAAR